jgi:protein TonB
VIEENVDTPPPSADKLKDEKISTETTEGEDGPMGPSDFIQTETVVDTKTDKVEEVFTFVSEMPSFPGGDGELFNLINSNVSYPERAKQQNIEGTVYIRFVVEADGTPSNFDVERGVDGGEMLDAEALRVCKQVLPKIKWNPGKQNGRAVRVWTRLPIRFTLQQ